jgi:hypothetical protein
MTARTDAQQRHERTIMMVLEVDRDTCLNTYGSAPCTAAAGAGNECYNTYATCQDKANFTRGAKTDKFCSLSNLVPGETVRPYISGSASITPTEIVPSKGLAMRSQTSLKLLDEPCPDHLEDPYASTRAAPAQGTFWARYMARNPNLVGRPVRVRRGYKVEPFTWDTFQTELFVIDAVKGPDSGGAITLVLSDPLKIADRNVCPAATDGALVVALPAVSDAGTAQAGGASTITLRTAASAVDSAYNTQEVYITSGVGAGQRRVISGYVGATRVATVSVAWAVQPTSASTYEVVPLSLNVGTDKGAQYPDPATSGKREFVRSGDEVIEYTAKAGDVLSWPDGTYRAQWGTAREDHDAEAAVQLCRAWINKRPWEVLRDLHTESGIDVSYLDLAGWEEQDTDWFNGGEITAILTEPEKASALIAEFNQDIGAIEWWDPVAQKAKMLANQPLQTGAITDLTVNELMEGSVQVERLDAERITQAAIYYGLRSATAERDQTKNYQAAAISIDLDAQGPNEYGDTRPSVTKSRWLSGQNTTFARQTAARKVARLRNAPYKQAFKLDPRNEVPLGDLVNITHPRLTDATGAPKTVRCRVVRMPDKLTHFEGTALSVGYGGLKYAVIAPNGLPDYGSASEAQRAYAYISNTGTGLMGNGDAGYHIV